MGVTELDDDETSDKRICHACIGDAYLSADVKESGVSSLCAYCGVTRQSLAIQEFADRIETAFAEHFTRTAFGPDSLYERMQADGESSYPWNRDGAPVLEAIQEAAGIHEEPAGDVLDILHGRHGDFDKDALLEESEFDPTSYYKEKGPDDQAWHEEWNRFEQSLKTEARFFSQAAAEHLAAVFGGINQLTTHSGRPLVVSAGPQTALDHLYRARVFQAEGPLKEAIGRPDLHLGSPPPPAARAGRMNALGIAVFYGATRALVAIAEVRPPVGSRVVVAKFVIGRPLHLLDLTALEDVHDPGSLFDPTLKRRLERAAFLRTLGGRMARPVMPDDEAFEYLPTQAVADFLATMNEPRLDGIIFPSPQTKDGRNVVLFHHSARVDTLNLPKGTRIEVDTGYWTEDGWEAAYSVSERVPPGAVPEPRPIDLDDGYRWVLLEDIPDQPNWPAQPNWKADFRTPALQVDTQSLTVHEVNAVDVTTTPHLVDRDRSERHKSRY